MHILLTNDDGIDAPGIAALREALLRLDFVQKVTTVAPLEALSGCSHQTTTHTDIRLERRSADQFAITGTPADCARVGLEIAEVDWVVSGVNFGANLGVDVHMSGTVAAAREAALLGKPSIALSQYVAAGTRLDWQVVAAWSQQALARLLARPGDSFYWNVNFPDPHAAVPTDNACPALKLASVDALPLPTYFDQKDDGRVFRYRSEYHQRPYVAGTDVDVCFGGHTSVSAVSLSHQAIDVEWDE